ncbi:MAG: DNA polymerase IV [candidate division WOR-3 bacterium]
MFLCIDLDAFFVSVERALNPELNGKPVVVGALPGERGVVASASYEARHFGIKSGMPISQAYKLCPWAIFLRPDFPKYEEFSKRFEEFLYHYSPGVEKASIDEAFVDIRGTERLFGPPLVLAQQIKQKIKEFLRLPCSIGIARTKVIAKIACEQSKPGGLLIVNPEEERKFLFPLSVDVLPGIGPKSLVVLKNLNIHTVEDFFKTPDWILEVALGQGYRTIKSFLNGGDYRLLNTIKSMSHEVTFPEDTNDGELIRSVFYQLIEILCQRLRQNGLATLLCIIKLRFSDFKTVTRRVRLPTSTNSQQRIYKFCLPVLQGMMEENKRIRLIGVALTAFQYDRFQPSIFSLQEERLNRLNQALDKARLKFGFNSVLPAKNLAVKFNTRVHSLITPQG